MSIRKVKGVRFTVEHCKRFEPRMREALSRGNHYKNDLKAMKTVFDATESGLPSYQTQRPNTTEMEHEPGFNRPDWASERLQHIVRTRVLENAWRGFREYDSPLAG